MEFESNGVRVVIPLDPAKHQSYTKPVHVEDEIDQFYKLTLDEETKLIHQRMRILNWRRLVLVFQTLMKN